MLGLARTDAASGSLLLNLEGLFTMGIAWLVFRENVDRRLLLGALAILGGAAILSWGGRRVEVDTGAVLIAAACLAWGIDNNLTRKLSSADPVADGDDQRPRRRHGECRIALLSGAAVPAAAVVGASAMVGFAGNRDQSRAVCAGIAPSRNGPHQRLFSLAPFIGAMVAIGLLHEAVT